MGEGKRSALRGDFDGQIRLEFSSWQCLNWDPRMKYAEGTIILAFASQMFLLSSGLSTNLDHSQVGPSVMSSVLEATRRSKPRIGIREFK
jgi:hypothetical protein